jgi:hypothetical protein
MRRFNLICHAYCLMTNHYHLLGMGSPISLSESIE